MDQPGQEPASLEEAFQVDRPGEEPASLEEAFQVDQPGEELWLVPQGWEQVHSLMQNLG